MTLVERIKMKCTEKHTSMNALEKELGFGNGSIRMWDKKTPGSDKVILVSQKLDVSLDWLLTEKESCDLTDEEKNLIALYRQADDRGKKVIMMNAELVNPSQEQQSSDSKIG